MIILFGQDRPYSDQTIWPITDEDKIRKYVKWQQQREKKLEATQDRLID